ncbi:hypothetical protein P153DRAFT_361508 [Dothidotthia symphoricarpi CBS 119687]|uniref:Uncharacterized protein n=1 Tax=Dothidotthia symphoricarpi CBS 119687 TaxID=1392245 RepID=A0A6A5ZZK1_9PLEO|nr:uncharacterized protein P153DRAFT_361508 [Dothidotthia symphoricarpi CBS 119687]KAF2123858.1 hypothetical protein P153DRAFT_361508 [Dothidotthia symphoricarpi CBS 119687]
MSTPPRRASTAPIRRRLDDLPPRYTPQASDFYTPIRAQYTDYASPQDAREQSTSMVIRSSPPPTSSGGRYVPSHRRISSHSGYLSSDKHLGRSEYPFSSPLLPSRALSRIEERRRAGLSSSVTTSPSTIAQPNPNYVPSKRAPERSPEEQTPITKAQSLLTPNRSETSGSHIPRPGRNRAESWRSSGRKSIVVPTDEWEDAGTSEVNKASDTRAGFVSKFKHALSLNSEEAPSQRGSAASFDAPEPLSTGQIISRRDSKRNVSPAETALRRSLENDLGKKTLSHRKSFAGSLRRLCQPEVLSYRAKPSVVSNESESDFGYIEPRVLQELPSNILVRVRARKTDNSPQYQNLPTWEPIKQTDDFKDRYTNERASYDRVPAYRMEVSSPLQGSMSSTQGFSSPTNAMIPNHQFRKCASLSSSPSSFVAQKLVRLQDVTSREPVELEQTKTLSAVIDQASAVAMPPTHVANCASQASVRIGNGISLMPPTTIVDQEPMVTSQSFSITSPSSTFTHSSTVPNYNLALQPPTEVFSQQPIGQSPRQGLIFAEASAIIYLLIAYVAVWLLLSNSEETMNTVDTANQMGMTLLAGAILCLLLHCAMGGRVTRVPRSVLRAIWGPSLCFVVFWGYRWFGERQSFSYPV